MGEIIRDDEKTWGMLCHLSALAGFIIPVGNILGPLIVWLIKKDESEFVDQAGKESLNFQISMTIYLTISAILIIIIIGIPLLIGLGLMDLILIIIAAVQTNNGTQYRYPLTIRFIN
jgi:uncharacterized Tic20 family protein